MREKHPLVPDEVSGKQAKKMQPGSLDNVSTFRPGAEVGYLSL
jgi:hypothetical protein